MEYYDSVQFAWRTHAIVNALERADHDFKKHYFNDCEKWRVFVTQIACSARVWPYNSYWRELAWTSKSIRKNQKTDGNSETAPPKFMTGQSDKFDLRATERDRGQQRRTDYHSKQKNWKAIFKFTDLGIPNMKLFFMVNKEYCRRASVRSKSGAPMVDVELHAFLFLKLATTWRSFIQ